MSGKSINEHDLLVAHRLKAKRNEKNITQTELGDVLGVTFQQIQKYEAGVSRISAGNLYKLAEFLGAPLDYFFAEM